YIRAGYNINSNSDTSPPSVPAGLTASAVSSTQVNLAWAPSTDNVGVAGYNVFRNGTKISSTPSTSYQDMQFPGTASYTVSAYDAAGNTSAQSAAVYSQSTPAPAPNPAVPPAVAIDSPKNGATYKNGSVNITASASSNSGIKSITIRGDS